MDLSDSCCIIIVNISKNVIVTADGIDVDNDLLILLVSFLKIFELRRYILGFLLRRFLLLLEIINACYVILVIASRNMRNRRRNKNTTLINSAI